MDKERSQGNFDVTMGSYDGVKTCDLVRIYILSILVERINKKGHWFIPRRWTHNSKKLQWTKERQN